MRSTDRRWHVGLAALAGAVIGAGAMAMLGAARHDEPTLVGLAHVQSGATEDDPEMLVSAWSDGRLRYKLLGRPEVKPDDPAWRAWQPLP